LQSLRQLLIATFLLVTAIHLSPAHGFAQSNISGLLQNYSAIQTTPDHEFITVRNRLRLELSRTIRAGNIYAEADFINRYQHSGESELLIREAYAEWFTSNYDIRLGAQRIIWGNSDTDFVNDILTPVDLREFLTQDPGDLRVGLNALNITRYIGAHSLQFVAAPVRQPNLLPEPESRWFPVQTTEIPLDISFRESNDGYNITDVQLALQFRWRPGGSFDADLMVYNWAHPMPAYAINFQDPEFGTFFPTINLIETYKTTPMVGYSQSWQASDSWIIKSEGLFTTERLFTFLPVSVDRLEDALDNPAIAFEVAQEFEIRDDGYLLTKPWYKQMIGLQTDWLGTTISLQAFLEIIMNYEDRILPQEYFPYASILLQRSFMRDRLQTVAVGRYNIFGKDYWTQLQAIYEIDDGFEIALGTNLFGGKSISPFYGHFTFNQFKENSFLFSQISFYF